MLLPSRKMRMAAIGEPALAEATTWMGELVVAPLLGDDIVTPLPEGGGGGGGEEEPTFKVISCLYDVPLVSQATTTGSCPPVPAGTVVSMLPALTVYMLLLSR